MMLRRDLEESVLYLRKRLGGKPRIAVEIGTGLGSLSDRMKKKTVVPYEDIPSFPRPSAFRQKNAVVAGFIRGKYVISFEGRFHAYEGHSFQEIGFPVRVAHALGARVFTATNIAGGINPSFRRGDFVLVEDHLNLMGNNPLVGRHEPWMGERFVDMSEPYDRSLLKLAEALMKEKGMPCKRGVHAAVLGPHFETKAEYRFLRNIGADLVSMSTVPEVLVARQLGMKTMVLSVISDVCDPDDLKPLHVPAVLAVAKRSAGPLSEFLTEWIGKIRV
ncbi:MAG: purine-nucleoside phosphorylase [Candidatus Omnitrophota bacterium]